MGTLASGVQETRIILTPVRQFSYLEMQMQIHMHHFLIGPVLNILTSV